MSAPPMRPTALVTGASSGLGATYASQLAALQHDLVLVARDRSRLSDLADRLTAQHGIQAEVLVADLSDREALEAVAARTADPRRPVDLLVNNAGYGLKEPLTGQVQELEAHFDVLARAVLILSNAAARSMVPRGHGQILNVGSFAALLSGGGHYTALKTYVLALTESLARDLRGTGVVATVVLPGYVHTEFHARAGMRGATKPSLAWLTADDVVRRSLHDARRGKLLSVPSAKYRIVATVLDLLPRSAVRATWRLASRRAPSRSAPTRALIEGADRATYSG